MKFVLQAGGELDLLTPDEMGQMLGKQTRDLAVALRADTLIEAQQRFPLTTSGTVNEQTVWACPTGFVGYLHRLAVTADTITPGAPLTTSGAWLAFWRDTASPMNLLYPLPAGGSAVLPTVITEGGHAAQPFRNGQRLVISGALGTLAASVQGLYVSALIRLERDHRNDREIAQA